MLKLHPIDGFHELLLQDKLHMAIEFTSGSILIFFKYLSAYLDNSSAGTNWVQLVQLA
jgi:hypothetical protein